MLNERPKKDQKQLLCVQCSSMEDLTGNDPIEVGTVIDRRFQRNYWKSRQQVSKCQNEFNRTFYKLVFNILLPWFTDFNKKTFSRLFGFSRKLRLATFSVIFWGVVFGLFVCFVLLSWFLFFDASCGCFWLM